MLTTTKIIHIWEKLTLKCTSIKIIYEHVHLLGYDTVQFVYQTLIASQKKVIFIVSVMRNSNLTKSYKVISSIQGVLMKDMYQLCCRQQELSVTAVCECWWAG